MSDGIHKVILTYDDGREEVRACTCPWCDVWRSTMTPDAIARLDQAVLDLEPPVWPDWLGPKSESP